MRAGLVVWVSVLLALPADADERIRRFSAEVAIDAEGGITVAETIVVRAEGDQIKRGIYRDFPTRYLEPWGRVVVPFSVVSVERDGAEEPFRQVATEDGVRIYIGREDRLLEVGDHHYRLSYRTGRQIGYFDTHDELYWNVTGNAWAFPIDRVDARVTIPVTLDSATTRLDAYSGFVGDRGGDYRATVDHDGAAVFSSTRTLNAGEGLTIAVGWPKGIVREPDGSERLQDWLTGNPEWRAGFWGLLILLPYYLLVWLWRGRDPRPGVLIPRYEPPANVSAADARFLSRMGFDQKTVAAAVIGLAVKGWLTIRESGGDYRLTAATGHLPPSNDEKVFLDALALPAGQSLAVDKVHRGRFDAARKALRNELKREHLKRHFVTNAPWTLGGLLISSVALFGAAVAGGDFAPASFFLLAWLTGWSFGVYALLGTAWHSWADVLRGKWSMVAPAIFVTLFSLPFVGAELFVIGILFANSPLLPVLLFLLAGVNFAFYVWLKAPTRLGRPIYDALAGFRLYLNIAEKDRINLLNPPDETPALFERGLPYALALDVEQRWSDRFAGVLAAASTETNGRPHWFSGTSWNAASLSDFSSSLGSGLSSALASAATAPGSSSGGGGGGSSGGGGGGGGGGGW